MDLILFHKSCPDGFCAAFIASKKYPETELLGLNHGEPAPYDKIKGKDVLVVDYSWRTRAENIKARDLAKSLQIYDHHKTAQAELDGLDFAKFDMNRSGAAITWDELFGGERPWFVNYVQDRDLWRHELLNTKEVSAYIMTLPFTIEAWSTLDRMTAYDADLLGQGALRHVEHYVRESIQHAQPGVIQGRGAWIVNAQYLNISEIGNELAKRADVGIGWFERADGQLQFSLRSIGDIDVSLIAKVYNGGGHKNAAGFQRTLADGRALLDEIRGAVRAF